MFKLRIFSSLLFTTILWAFSNQVIAALIELQNGDILNATIEVQSKTAITIRHSILGTITIPKEKIKSVNVGIDETQLADPADELANQVGEEINQGIFGTAFLKGWESNLDIGLNGAGGSSNNTSFRVGFTTNYEDKEHRWNFNSFFLYKQEDNVATDNKFTANLSKDWFITDSSWFYFSRGGVDWDQFRDWDYRLRFGGGSGYQFIKTKTVELATRHGLNSTLSFFPHSRVLELELLLGLDWTWVISKQQSLTFNNTVYPALTDLGEFRNVTNFEWKHNISYYNGLAIKFGFTNEYDTTESRRYDLKYYASLVWGL